jgi:DNA excision repair protein ERCC-2
MLFSKTNLTCLTKKFQISFQKAFIEKLSMNLNKKTLELAISNITKLEKLVKQENISAHLK